MGHIAGTLVDEVLLRAADYVGEGRVDELKATFFVHDRHALSQGADYVPGKGVVGRRVALVGAAQPEHE